MYNSNVITRILSCVVLFLLCCSLFASFYGRDSSYSFEVFLNKLSTAPRLDLHSLSLPSTLITDDWGWANFFRDLFNFLWSVCYGCFYLCCCIVLLASFVGWVLYTFLIVV